MVASSQSARLQQKPASGIPLVQAVPEGEIAAVRTRMFLDYCNLLDREGIAYVILSGYRDYPQRIGSDVDFMVSEEDFCRLPRLFAQDSAIPGASLIQFLRHETSACYFVFARQVGSRLAFLHPDAAASFRRGGRLWLTPEQVLPTRRKAAAGFWIPAAPVEFEYYYIKRVDKGIVDRAHALHLAELLRQDQDGCLQRLERLAPRGEVPRIVEAIETADVAWFAASIKALRAALRASPQRESAVARLANVIVNTARRLVRIVEPSGFVVAVLGPDGSGKTTILEHLEKELAPAFRRLRRFHLRPHFGAVPSSKTVTAPHAEPARGWIASAAKMALFIFDYWSGWLGLVWPAKIRSTLVFFDRYYHDMLADPLRYRLPDGFGLTRTLGGLIPRPDRWLVLDAPPAMLVARKGELTLFAAEHLSAAYRRLGATLPRSEMLNTGAGLEETLSTAVGAMRRALRERTRQRIGIAS